MSEHLQADLIPLYTYGELSEREAQGVRDHMSECAECAVELADLERIRRVLDEERVPLRLSPDVRAQIMKTASREIRIRRMSRWFRPFTPVTMLAAAATAVFVAVLATVVVRQETNAPATQVAEVSRDKDAGMPSAEPPSAQPMPVAAAPGRGGDRMQADQAADLKKRESSMAKEKARMEVGLGEAQAESTPRTAPEELMTQPAKAAGAEADGRAVDEEAPKIGLKQGVLGGAPLVEKQAPTAGFAPAPERRDRAEPGAAETGREEQALWRKTTDTEVAQTSSVEGKKIAGGAAAGQVAAPSAPPSPGAVDENFENMLAEARDTASRGDRKKTVDVYRKLLKQYPQRKSEILRTITDKTIAAEVEKR